MTAAPARPRDVALAAALTITGSVMALVGIFSAQGELGSSQVRREIESLLAGEQFGTVDLTVDTVLQLVEYALMVASAASVAAIVLAVFVLRRHNPSRIALTVLGGLAAMLLVLQWPTGLLVAVFVVYTVSLLWRAPVRGWFAEPAAQSAGGAGTWAMSSSGGDDRPEPGREPEPGRDPQPGPELEPGRNPDAVPDPDPRWPSDPAQPPGTGGPAPYPGPWPPDRQQPQHPTEPERPDPAGQRPPDPSQRPYGEQMHGYPGYPPPPGQGHPVGYGYPGGYYGYPPPADPHRRPGQVVAAHVLTWIGTAFGLLTGAVFLLAAGSPEIIGMVREQLGADTVGRGEFVSMLRAAGALTALWSLAVLVVSVFTWRRLRWAAILLSVMGAGYVLVQLVALLSGQAAVVFTIAWVSAVVLLLWVPSSREWYAGQRTPGPPPGPPGPPAGGPGAGPPQRPRQPW